MGGMGIRRAGMGLNTGTTPSIMGMMVLSRNLFYLCGDPDSWDKRSLIFGMMGKMDTGGRVGGEVRAEVGGMGGAMRSVPSTELPSALLSPGQTRNLPTRLVLLTPPDPPLTMKLPEKGEPLQLCDIAESIKIRRSRRRFGAWPRRGLQANRPIGHVALDRGARLGHPGAGPVAGRILTSDAYQRFRGSSRQFAVGETGRVLFEVEGRGRGQRSTRGRSQECPAGARSCSA